jgi:uncharacterized membrane protein
VPPFAHSHGTDTHSHGPDPDAPPPSAEVLGRRRRAVRLMLLVLVPVALATLLGAFLLWPSGGPSPAEVAARTFVPPGTSYPGGTIASLQPYDCSVTGNDGRTQPLTCGTAVVQITSGEGSGSFQQVDLPPDVVASGVGTGDAIVLVRDAGAEGGAKYSFYDYARTTPMLVLALLFVIVVGAVARLRGLAALLGLAFAFVVLLEFMLPALLSGSSPTWVSLVGSAAIMFVVLYLAHGFSARTTTALLGTLFGLVLVAGLGSIAVDVARLTGFSSEDTIQLQQFDPTLDFSGLVIAGVVVAGLGVLNDVTITQASAVWQLNEVDPTLSWRQLFSRGMAIGRDHIASTVYTIVFAYAGAALPLLLLFEIYRQPVGAVLTGSAVAEEIIRTLVGAIALVLAVPVTTAVGAFVAKAAGPAGTPEDEPVGLRARLAR